MDRLDIQECEENYRKAARALDALDLEYSSMWLVERASSTSDLSATHATTSSIGPYWNELKAKRHIAELRLEEAWRREHQKWTEWLGEK